MSLSPDQQALLELVLERGQSYSDLATMMDLDEAEVRARARGALGELAGTDPDRTVALTDYLLGQADPIDRADVVRHLRDNPAELDMVRSLAAELREIAPGAELPRLPGEARSGPAVRRPPMPRALGRLTRRQAGGPSADGTPRSVPPPKPRGSLSARQSRTLVALGSGAVLVVVIVLAVAGAFSGGSGDEGATSSTTPGVGEQAVRVTLNATAGGKASGSAVFATTDSGQEFVDFDLSGLGEPPQGKAYVAWLLFNPQRGHPLTPIQVGPSGRYQDRLPLQDFQIALAQKAKFVDVSLSDANTLNQEIAQAFQAAHPVIPYQGPSVLRGKIPRSSG
jgi:hypothetical protein